MAADNSNQGQLPHQLRTLVQQLVVLDGQGRVSEVYTVETGARTGEACTKVTYVYPDATSTIVVGMKEENDVWPGTQPAGNPGFFVPRS